MLNVLLFALLLQMQSSGDCPALPTRADQTLYVHPGQAFAVVLNTQPGTGFSWSISEEPDPSVATRRGDEVVSAEAAVPGRVEHACFHFEGTGEGQTAISFAYARPFDTSAPPAQRLDVRVVVSTSDVPVQVPLAQEDSA